MVKDFPTKFLQQRHRFSSSVWPRVVLKQTNSIGEQVAPAVLNSASKPFQFCKICAGINGCTTGQKVNQKNAEVKETVTAWLNGLAAEFYDEGIVKTGQVHQFVWCLR
jgi:hypothetical protein